MYRRTFVAGLAGLATAPLAAAPLAAAPARTTLPSGTLQQLLDAEHAAGMPGVFAEVRDGDDSWRGASGVADVDTGRPVRPGFGQRVGSITKSFVATTVLQLVGEHRVRLDAPIARYLPDVVPGTVGQQVTVRMLLNHTSGIGNYTNVLLATPEQVLAAQHTTAAPRDLVRTGLAMPPTFAPGAGWSYSNTNYIILGLLIERITHHPYAVEVSRRILRPLHLDHTYFPGTGPVIRGPHGKAYVPWTDGKLRDFSVFNMSTLWAAGELISTTHDLDRFYRALLQGRLLRPAQLAEMRTTVPAAPGFDYGLGLFSVTLPCGKVWGHDGGVIGMSTISWHSPDGRRQVSLAENMDFYAPPGQPHPIDTARAHFLVAALCGPGVDPHATVAGSQIGPRTPDVTLRA